MGSLPSSVSVANPFLRHVEPESISVLTYVGPNRERLSSNWTDKGIVLTTYDTLRSEHKTNGPLIQKVWARVILDEGMLSNNKIAERNY